LRPDRVLDGRVRALAVVRQHCVRGIAQQHRPGAEPAQQRLGQRQTPQG